MIYCTQHRLRQKVEGLPHPPDFECVICYEEVAQENGAPWLRLRSPCCGLGGRALQVPKLQQQGADRQGLPEDRDLCAAKGCRMGVARKLWFLQLPRHVCHREGVSGTKLLEL